MYYSYPIFKEGHQLTASDLNALLDEVLRRTKLFVAPPLALQDGYGGATITYADNKWYAVICGQNNDGSYIIYEVVPYINGTWQLLIGGRGGNGYEFNGMSGIPQGKVVQVKPSYNGQYIFECYATNIEHPVECGSMSSGSSGGSIGPIFEWVLLSMACVDGEMVSMWGNLDNGDITDINPYSSEPSCMACTACGSSSSSSSGGSGGSSSSTSGGSSISSSSSLSISSSSLSSGSSVSIACCTAEVPATLFCTITAVSGSCSCMAGSFSLFYNGSNAWTGGLGVCSVDFSITMTCLLMANQFSMQICCPSSPSAYCQIISPATATCSPFSCNFGDFVFSTPGCCNGTVSVTVTA